MPGFSSMDDMISKISAGQVLTIPWNKITGAAAYTAGRWYDSFTLTGSPPAGAFSGTALTTYTLSDASTGGILHGGNKTPNLKYLLNIEALVSAATGVPSYLLLVDYLAYYPGINMNVGGASPANDQTMLSSNAGVNILPNRQGVQHTGANCMMFLEALSTTGASAHNINITYTNSAGTSGKNLSTTLAATASAIVPHILHSGISTNNYGPFMPLAAGDLGVRSVQTLNL